MNLLLKDSKKAKRYIYFFEQSLRLNYGIELIFYSEYGAISSKTKQ